MLKRIRFASWGDLKSQPASERAIHRWHWRFSLLFVLLVVMAEHMKKGIHELAGLYWIWVITRFQTALLLPVFVFHVLSAEIVVIF